MTFPTKIRLRQDSTSSPDSLKIHFYFFTLNYKRQESYNYLDLRRLLVYNGRKLEFLQGKSL